MGTYNKNGKNDYKITKFNNIFNQVLMICCTVQYHNV